MVNLRAAANRLTSAINPNQPARVYVSAGYVTDAAGHQTPAYKRDDTDSLVQVQALSKKELEHLAELNISNATRGCYANRQLTGVDRVLQSGGDLLDMSDGRWLVTAVLEGWTTAGWCKVALTRQLDTGAPLRQVPGLPVWVVQDWQGDDSQRFTWSQEQWAGDTSEQRVWTVEQWQGDAT